MACVTEAMHLLHYSGGWQHQKALWSFIMDLADASLVATVETRQLRRIFTLDSDFRVYRANDKEPFEVVP